MTPTKLPSTGEVCTCILVEPDLHEECPGFFRAFYATSPNASSMVPVFGYCTAGHTFRRIKDVVADVRRYGYEEPVYRNGRKIA